MRTVVVDDNLVLTYIQTLEGTNQNLRVEVAELKSQIIRIRRWVENIQQTFTHKTKRRLLQNMLYGSNQHLWDTRL